MLTKTFIKAGILVVALSMVIYAMGFFSTLKFEKSLTEFFGFDVKPYTWCPEHTVDFQWQDQGISEKWKTAAPAAIQAKFCRVALEPIRDVDIQKIVFKPLLKAQSATAQTALLEWNPQTSLFRAQGLPFYSSSLSRELLDR